MAIVYESDDIEVHFHEGLSEYLLVTFNNFATLADGKTFWGSQFVKKYNIRCLSFMAKARHWFPAQAMEPAIVASRPYLSSSDVLVGYGSSMGGHGVLRWGNDLGLSRALVFSPQFSIDPILAPFDTRFVEHYIPEIHRGACIRSENLPKESLLVFDPKRSDDAGHALAISGKDPSVHLVGAHFTDHLSIRLLSHSDRAAATLGQLSLGRSEDVWKLHSQVRSWKKELAPYRIFVALAAYERRPQLANNIIASLFINKGFSDDCGQISECMRILTRSNNAELCAKFRSLTLAC